MMPTMLLMTAPVITAVSVAPVMPMPAPTIPPITRETRMPATMIAKMVATRAIEAPKSPWNSLKQRPMAPPRSNSTTAGRTSRTAAK